MCNYFISMSKQFFETNKGIRGGMLKGKSHYDSEGNSIGGIKAVVTDQGGTPVELEGNEVIINKKTVQSDKVLTVKGTPKEILSTLNQMDGNGVAIGDEDAEILDKYKTGGELIKRADGSYSRRGLWDNIRDNVGSGRKPTKQMLEQEAKIKSKYHLGGDMSKHLAPNGKPSNLNHEQWHLVRTPEFKSWFGDWENDPENSSKVVDRNGEPLVVYHGTTQKFNSFDKEKQNLATGFGDFGAGFYFTSSFNTARYYTLKSEKDRIIMNVFLNIKKPFIVELNWEKLSDESIYNYKKIKGLQGYQRDIINDSFKEDRPSKYITKNIGDFIFQDILIVNGYDGVFVNRINIHKEKNVNQEDEILYLHEIVAFEPNQIKLADGTNTTFDANNDDIRFAEGGSIPEQGTLYTKDKKTKLEYIKNGSDYEFIVYEAEDNPVEGYSRNQYKRHNKNKATMNYNQFVDFLHSESYLHDKFKTGGSISRMTPSELKEFYASDEGKKLDAQTYSEWKRLVNMTKSELENFYNSVEGKKAGLTTSQAKEQGIDSGRESARWIIKMKEIPYKEWSSDMWRWAKKQINFIKRMSGMRGRLYDDKGNKTRKHTALLIWGHNPEQKFAKGGGLRKFKGGGELSKKALAVETNDLTDFVRKYFISDGRIDVADAMQELFGNKGDKSIADEYRKRIGLHKKGGLTISQLAHNLWEQHRDEVREGIDDSDFRNAVEEVLISEYGVSSMIKSLMEKSEGNEQDNENEYWMSQYDEGDDEYYEDLSDEEVADYFKDMEGFERETYKDENKKIIISGVEIPKEIDELFKEKYELDYYYSFYGKILNSFPKDEMGLITDSAKNTKEYKDVKQKYDLAKRKADNFNTSKEGKELIKFQGKIRDRMDRMEISRHYRDLAEELAKGTEHEMEHLETLKKVAEHKITPEQAVVQTSLTHIKENPNYYEDLAKMERENKIPKGNLVLYTKLKGDIKFKASDFRGNQVGNLVYAPLVKPEDYLKFKEAIISTSKENPNTSFRIVEIGNNKVWYDSETEPKQAENEESIPDLIEGLKVLADSLEGAEKKEIEDVIEGLEILLESDNSEVMESTEPIQSFTDKEDGAVYTVEKDDKGVWTVFSKSSQWAKRNEYPSGFASKEDAVSIAKLEAGIEKEEDPEGKFMNKFDKFEKGGEFKMATGGKIVFKPITTPL